MDLFIAATLFRVQAGLNFKPACDDYVWFSFSTDCSTAQLCTQAASGHANSDFHFSSFRLGGKSGIFGDKNSSENISH